MIDDIKKLIASDKAVLGTNLVLKHLKKGDLAKVYVSSNCPDDMKKDIAHYAALFHADIINVDMPNDELGTVCKKPFAVSLLGQRR